MKKELKRLFGYCALIEKILTFAGMTYFVREWRMLTGHVLSEDSLMGGSKLR